MFFSTYKSSRLLGRDAFRAPVMKLRGLSEYIGLRPWNSYFYFILPGDVRILIVGMTLMYFPRKWFVDHQDSSEYNDKSMIMRWGGTVEEVRKNLPSAADQVRAKMYWEFEKNHSFFLPKTWYVKPEGCPLPGPELYGYGSH